MKKIWQKQNKSLTLPYNNSPNKTNTNENNYRIRLPTNFRVQS